MPSVPKATPQNRLLRYNDSAIVLRVATAIQHQVEHKHAASRTAPFKATDENPVPSP